MLFLYADLFIFTEDNSVDDGYYLYVLIIFVPFPLFLSMVTNFLIERNEEHKRSIVLRMQKIFPLACFILIVGQFLLFSKSSIWIASVMSISITMMLLFIGIYLLINDLRD